MGETPGFSRLKFGHSGAASPGYICAFIQQPEIKWGSSSDQTNHDIGLVCSRLESPLPGTGLGNWAHWFKITQLIESLP